MTCASAFIPFYTACKSKLNLAYDGLDKSYDGNASLFYDFNQTCMARPQSK